MAQSLYKRRHAAGEGEPANDRCQGQRGRGRGGVARRVGMLRETAGYTRLVAGVTDALLDTYSAIRFTHRAKCFVMLRRGSLRVRTRCRAVLGDRQDLVGPVASMRTALRLLDRSIRHLRRAWRKPLRLAQPARGDNSCAGHEVPR